MKDEQIRNIESVPFIAMLSGLILGPLGLVLAIKFSFFCLLIPLLSLLFMSTSGSVINLSNKKIKIVHLSVLGIDFSGPWKDLPVEIDYISVFRAKQNIRLHGIAPASSVVSSDLYKLNLFYGNKKIEAYKTKSINKAFSIAKQISKALNIDVLDATVQPSKWL